MEHGLNTERERCLIAFEKREWLSGNPCSIRVSSVALRSESVFNSCSIRGSEPCCACFLSIREIRTTIRRNLSFPTRFSGEPRMEHGLNTERESALMALEKGE